MSKQFKAGDLVYRPILSTKIYKLGATNSDSLTIMSDGGKGCFYPDGNYFTWHANPSIFHATSENHALLEQLYGVEFEKPPVKLTSHEIIAAMLERFLSDLCGREAQIFERKLAISFLSDLCGREGVKKQKASWEIFLSDLCGREE